MAFTIRAVRPEELETVGELTVRAYVDGGHLDGSESYASALRDAADRAESAELLVAVEGDKVLGSVTIARPGERYFEIGEPGEMEFRMLGVVPEAAGQGIGRALVQAVVDRARAEGRRRIVLSTQSSMTTAHRLYRSFGFRRTPERDWSPVPGIDLLTFALDLSPGTGV